MELSPVHPEVGHDEWIMPVDLQILWSEHHVE